MDNSHIVCKEIKLDKPHMMLVNLEPIWEFVLGKKTSFNRCPRLTHMSETI